MISARQDSEKKFIHLEHIRDSQAVADKIRLVLLIRGAGNCHIVLSPVERLDRETDAFYDFGKSCENSIHKSINLYIVRYIK